MLRLLIWLVVTIIPGSGVEIDQFVNCGGATQSRVTLLPEQTRNSLYCNQNGVIAFDSAEQLPIVFEVVAVRNPTDFGGPLGDVEARQTLVGSYIMTIQPLPAFWTVCLNPTTQGNGTTSASGFWGRVLLELLVTLLMPSLFRPVGKLGSQWT